jgi:hypothetical protein
LSIFIPPISPQSPSLIIRGWYNRPVSGRSTKRFSVTSLIKKKIKKLSPAKKNNRAISPQDVELHISRGPSHFNIREMESKKEVKFITFIAIARAQNIFFFQKQKKKESGSQPTALRHSVACGLRIIESPGSENNYVTTLKGSLFL